MKRPFTVAVLLACQLLGGCVHEQTLAPAGENADAYVATILDGIEQRKSPPESALAAEPDSSIIGDTLNLTVMICAGCLGILLVAVYTIGQGTANTRF